MVNRSVGGWRKHGEILQPIVITDKVDVMDFVPVRDRDSRLVDDEPVFHHIPVSHCKRMPGQEHPYVPVAMSNPTLPRRV
jgi:hypothetical protein